MVCRMLSGITSQLTAMRIPFLWNVMLRHWIIRFRNFKGTQCLHLYRSRVSGVSKTLSVFENIDSCRWLHIQGCRVELLDSCRRLHIQGCRVELLDSCRWRHYFFRKVGIRLSSSMASCPRRRNPQADGCENVKTYSIAMLVFPSNELILTWVT